MPHLRREVSLGEIAKLEELNDRCSYRLQYRHADLGPGGSPGKKGTLNGSIGQGRNSHAPRIDDYRSRHGGRCSKALGRKGLDYPEGTRREALLGTRPLSVDPTAHRRNFRGYLNPWLSRHRPSEAGCSATSRQKPGLFSPIRDATAPDRKTDRTRQSAARLVLGPSEIQNVGSRTDSFKRW